MLYETSRLLASQSYQHWVSQELFSTGWFVMVIVLAIVYATWFKIVDKSKLTRLLLLGCLLAVGFGLSDLILEGLFGLWEYQIRLIPLMPSMYVTSYTIGPILFMIVAQYTTSWKSYIGWGSLGTAIISFGLIPIYIRIGIVQYHNFNVFYGFILYMTGGIIGRAIYLWLASIEQSQPASSRVAQVFPGLQPAASKPLHDDNDGKTDGDQ
jgi:hypothetical protein